MTIDLGIPGLVNMLLKDIVNDIYILFTVWKHKYKLKIVYIILQNLKECLHLLNVK